MTEELRETILIYDKQQLVDWKNGDKSLAPGFIHDKSMIVNQPGYHFGETFVLNYYSTVSSWEGTAFYTFGTQWPKSKLRAPGNKMLEALLPPDKLAESRHLRRAIYGSNSGKGDPDLFMYHPTLGIKFVEVKKGADRIHEWQLTCLSQIRAIFDLPVEIVYMRERNQRYSAKTYVLNLETYEGYLKPS